MTHLKPIGDLKGSDIASLRDGTHEFRIEGPDGGPQHVRLYVWGKRSKTRRMQFDLYPSEWNLGETHEILRFCEDSSAYWQARNSRLPKGGVTIPGPRGTCLTFAALKEDAAEWTLRAAKLLANKANLVPMPLWLELAARPDLRAGLLT